MPPGKFALKVLLYSLLLLGWLAPTSASPASAYSLGDLRVNLAGLLQSTDADSWLVIEIAGSEDFVQLYGSGGTAYLDFPMVTARQLELRPAIERACAELGLKLEINEMSNGAELLDYRLPGTPARATEVITALLERVYGVDGTTILYMESNGFALRNE